MSVAFFRITAEPKRIYKILLPVALFTVLIGAYAIMAHIRHIENPQDKIVPTLSQMRDGIIRYIVEDRDGKHRLMTDAIASGERFLIALGVIFTGVLIGLHVGLLPYMELTFYRFILFIDKVPALALLPILFILLGTDELAKISLIVVGVMPTIVLDTFLRTKDIAKEQITKGKTLGASDMEIAYRIVLPQIFPGVLNTIRLNFKAMILFLIAGEALAAEAGLGYRIFLLRRYIAMDVIIPYVIVISLLAFLADLAVRIWISCYKWHTTNGGDNA